MTTTKSWLQHKKLKAENYDISKFILPPDTHSKYATEKEIFEAFLRAHIIHLVKYTTM